MPVTTIYNFFASTKLAIIILSCLIGGSMLGTIIPQSSDTFSYDLYNSWWFIFLLGLLSTNLVICSIERWPAVWKHICPGSVEIRVECVQKWPHQTKWQPTHQNISPLTNLATQLRAAGWKNQQAKTKDQSFLIFQKGKYTRLGTLLVHCSILIILTGGVFGKLYGFKSYLKLPEMEQISRIVSNDTTKHVDLDYAVRCDSFFIERYPSGEIKNYGSRLAFIENGEVTKRHTIYVNSPYKYKGVTFHQSDFEGYNSFIFSITNTATENDTTLIAPFQQQVEWTAEGIHLGVINAELNDDSATRFKLWFTTETTDPVQHWMFDNKKLTIRTGQTVYEIHVKQLYASGLQVSKDPGLLLVYTGFVSLLAGLVITFFMSHKRVALYIRKDEGNNSIYFSGTSNKHPETFLKTFSTLTEILQKKSTSAIHSS
jgi:cytochrome c biogenesis protein